MGYAGLDALGADATRALPVFRPAGRDRVWKASGGADWYTGRQDGSHADGHDIHCADSHEVRYADSGRIPDRSWQRLTGWYPAGDDRARPVVDWYARYGRFPDDVPGSGY
jgi:hypothetical protein